MLRAPMIVGVCWDHVSALWGTRSPILLSARLVQSPNLTWRREKVQVMLLAPFAGGLLGSCLCFMGDMIAVSSILGCHCLLRPLESKLLWIQHPQSLGGRVTPRRKWQEGRFYLHFTL